jgi:exopolysaccharide production repressor protein
MSLANFVVGLILVIVLVGTWSAIDSATAGTILVRLVICAVALQLGYFLVVGAMIFMTPKRQIASKEAPQQVKRGAAKAKDIPAGNSHS